jgi:hypothetical protein
MQISKNNPLQSNDVTRTSLAGNIAIEMARHNAGKFGRGDKLSFNGGSLSAMI